MLFQKKIIVGIISMILVLFSIIVFLNYVPIDIKLLDNRCLKIIAWEYSLDKETSPEKRKRAMLAMLDALPSAFDKPLVSSREAAKEAKGIILPEDFFRMSVYINTGSNANDPAYTNTNWQKYGFEKFFLAAWGFCEANDPDYIQWMAKQSDILPPRRKDIVAYQVYHSEEPWRKSMYLASREFWRKMAKGDNPIYRHLAYKNVHRWNESAQELLDTIESMLHEDDVEFIMLAMDIAIGSERNYRGQKIKFEERSCVFPLIQEFLARLDLPEKNWTVPRGEHEGMPIEEYAQMMIKKLEQEMEESKKQIETSERADE